MRMCVQQLEPREVAAILAAAGDTLATPAGPLTPYPGVSVEACRVPDTTGDGVPEIATVPAAGGGPAVRVYDGATLEMRASFFAFDSSLRWGYRIAADRQRIAVGIGDGGGPLVAEFDSRTFAETARYWAGDPESRRGVSLSADDFDFAPTIDVAGGVPYDLSRLGVRLIGPGEPTAGQWQGVRESLSYLPPTLVRDYLAAGVSIDAVTGPLADYPGVPADYATDFGGVYVPPARSAVYRLGSAAGSVDTLLHELGHAVDAAVLGGASNVGDWLYVWGSVPWGTEYERTRANEAWAESFARYLRADGGLPVAVRVYFDNLFARMGW